MVPDPSGMEPSPSYTPILTRAWSFCSLGLPPRNSLLSPAGLDCIPYLDLSKPGPGEEEVTSWAGPTGPDSGPGILAPILHLQWGPSLCLSPPCSLRANENESHRGKWLALGPKSSGHGALACGQGHLQGPLEPPRPPVPAIEQGLARPSRLILKFAVSLSSFDTWKAAPARTHNARTHNGCCQAAQASGEGPPFIGVPSALCPY